MRLSQRGLRKFAARLAVHCQIQAQAPEGPDEEGQDEQGENERANHRVQGAWFWRHLRGMVKIPSFQIVSLSGWGS